MQTLKSYPLIFLATSYLILLSVLSLPSFVVHAENQTPQPTLTPAQKETQITTLFQIIVGPSSDSAAQFELLEALWTPDLTSVAIEAINLSNSAQKASRFIDLLERKTGQTHGSDVDAWYQWLWQQPYVQHPHYPDFKSSLYSLIDTKFRAYFYKDATMKIRLDEVRWGGVKQDGIPPLRNPKMLKASKASYLEDDHVVFGLVINGDARAYPKRILAWHEMFVDEVGGEPVAGVYCTLCGSMILYKTTHQGVNYQLGTSGFLYRSNKLMYDKATQSLWNTLWGKPVIGKLADTEIKLEKLSVVTTTWGDWKRQHPDTQVLSLETGHSRNYDEGVAYQSYFATDELMFTVPNVDSRLANKAEVVALIDEDDFYEPLAIDTAYLKKHPVLNDTLGKQNFVALTNQAGAVRVYERKNKSFAEWDSTSQATEKDGTQWQVHEDYLQANNGERLKRLPSHRAFWFGWYAAYPDTRLIR